jgi:transcriptional regulator with XRE-family HTH domain
MGIAAHFDTSPAQELRDGSGASREPRRTLLLEARGETASGTAAEVMIHNISASGLLLETASGLAQGESLDIDLPEAGRTRAEVIWTSGMLYGCAFAEPLGHAALSAAQLRSLVGVTLAPEPAERRPQGALGARLQRLRHDRGLTLSELARRLGVSKPTVWAWEQGKARPVPGRFAPIAEALGVEVSELQGGDDNPGLRDLVARARQQIAAAYGTTEDRVRIAIEL